MRLSSSLAWIVKKQNKNQNGGKDWFALVCLRIKLGSITHIGWRLFSSRDVAEDQGVAVVFGGGSRLPDTLQQLPHGSVMPLPDQLLTRPHIDRLGIQLEVLRQEDIRTDQKG